MEPRSISPLPPGEAKKPLSIIILKFILHQWLLIGFGIGCVLAYYFPEVGKHGGIIKAEYSVLYGAVALIFLISGLSIPKDKLLRHMMNFRLHVQVQGVSFLVIPAIMTGLVRLIDATDHAEKIDRAVLAGYIILSCLPTTIASNVVMTRAAGGDEAASLVEVFIANILGPFVTPGWAVALMPKSSTFDVWKESNGDLQGMYRSVFKGLGLSVFLPLSVGQLVRWKWAERTAWAMDTFYLAKLSTACLVLVFWASFSTCFATGALESLSHETIAFVTLFNVLFYISLTCVSFIIAYPPAALIPTEKPTVTTNASSSTTATTTVVTSKKAKLHSLLNAVLTRLIKQTPPLETIAICFCGPAKTTSLGIPMLYAMYPTIDLRLVAKLTVPVILYTTEQIFCAHFMVYLFKKWGERKQAEWNKKGKRAQGGSDTPRTGCENEQISVSTGVGGTAEGMHGALDGRDNAVDVDVERGEKGIGVQNG
ncbi:solute carrier family 10 (sodium/bile acid cotransporter), member 7 [Blastomyces parvus]|uniref:Solute carrier family 10 (Sodium/bile acid cotransporter), member 7 n=1 Tax=Blastomyces parvus TaxID=2060905 RepID=A0A2B7X114_9EURO|nr:solute carrier family 10 (sodium/bile acid cotransporter), member 7 [Blastomyces parvus]